MSRVALAAQATRQAWHKFNQTSDPGHLQGIAPHIAESWKRCRAKGVDPGLMRLPHASDINPEADRLERTLLELASPVLASLRSGIQSGSLFLTLTSKFGRNFHREGNRTSLRAADKIDLVAGALTDDDLIGTNGAGTGLRLNRGIVVDLNEHYCEGFRDFANSSAIITHPATKETLAVIDLVLYQRSITAELTMLVHSLTMAIELRLAEREYALQYALRERFIERTARHRAGALAIDRNGLIVAEKGATAKILGLGQKMCGRLVSSIPALSGVVKSILTSDIGIDCVVPQPDSDSELTVTAEPVRKGCDYLGTIIFLPDRRVSTSLNDKRTWKSRFQFNDLIGQHESFKSAIDVARKIAKTDLPILLAGETGTGKELLAHSIHNLSDRKSGPFVSVNCAAIPQELLVSELFGYEKGAFTGARMDGMRGKFMQAHDGVIFLDEITETSLAFQSALLRVLQDQEVVPVGSDRPLPIDVRVIAATNRDIMDCLERGAFRQDLFFRLSCTSITLPPLRERTGDVMLLARHFLDGEGQGKTLSARASEMIQKYSWPGNVRELKNALQSAAAIVDGDIIDAEHLPPSVRANHKLRARSEASHSGPASMKAIEAQAIRDALKASRGNIAMAADILGIGRSSLYRKIQRLA